MIRTFENKLIVWGARGGLPASGNEYSKFGHATCCVYLETENKKRIESLEKKLINNMEENVYTELLKLKSQINRD